MASILSNAGIAALGRIITAAIGLAVTLLLTRALGPASYGAYIVVLSYATLFQIAADSGLYLTLTRELGSSPETYKQHLAPLLTLRIVLLLVACLVAIGIAFLIPALKVPTIPLLLILAALAAQSISQLCLGIYQVNNTLWPATVGDIAGRAVQVVGVGILYWWLSRSQLQNSGVILAAFTFTIGASVALIWHIFFLPLRKLFRFAPSWSKWKSILKVSWPLGLLLVLNTIYFRIDMVMLPIWRGADEVGLYALAYRLIENLLFFPAMFGGLLLPQISRYIKEQASSKIQQLLQEGLRVTAVAVTLIVVLLITKSREITILAGGSEFAPAASLVQILTLALACMFFGNLFGFTLVAQGKSKFLVMLYAGLVVFNILANSLTIPVYGAIAAAWVTVATELIATTTAAVIVLRSLSVSLIDPWLLRLLVASGATVVFAVWLPDSHSIIQLILIVGFFGASSIVAGVLNQEYFHRLLSPQKLLFKS